MFINDDGIKLHVELEKPENAPEKMPLVIVIHGFTGHMDEAKDSKYIEIPNAPHCFDDQLVEMTDIIKSWMQERF